VRVTAHRRRRLALSGGGLHSTSAPRTAHSRFHAGEWIGDADHRTLKRSYIKSRPDELREVA